MAPTGHNALYSDYAEITAYDAKSGKVDLKEALKFYHFGTNESTASKYNGVDMRGEVILLTRNVRVVGDDYDAWGGQIVTSDTINSEGGIQAGLLEMDSVELYNVSQRNTYKAGLRFEAALTNKHFVNNSVIHKGLSWGLYIKSSANVQVKDTSIIGFMQVGVNIHASQSIDMDGMYTFDVRHRSLTSAGAEVEKESCVCSCSFFEPDTSCRAVTIRNSITGGCKHGGFVV